MDNEILTLEDAAMLFNVSIKTFIKLLKEEKVPARKIGREWRFSRKALIEWLSSGDSQMYSSSEGDTREFFNKLAGEWEEFRKGYDEQVKTRLLSLASTRKADTLIDLGCGDGYLSRAVAPMVNKVVAVDISAEMLRLLEKRAAEAGIGNIESLESDGQDMPVPDSAADMVCASMYLHHIEEPEAAVKEMNRVLKQGGHVFVAELAEHKNKELMEKMHDLWPGFKPPELKELFKRNGFGDIRVEKLPRTEGNNGREDILILTAVKRG